MSYRTFLRSKKLEVVGTVFVPYDRIKCQYNPDRFKEWSQVCGPSLTIHSSPFWEYLSSRSTDKYRRLFRLYKRDARWITDNIKAFAALATEIQTKGFDGGRGLPIVLETPSVNNPYNSGFYEIYEGHRRVSICMYAGIEQEVKVCRLIW